MCASDDNTPPRVMPADAVPPRRLPLAERNKKTHLSGFAGRSATICCHAVTALAGRHESIALVGKSTLIWALVI